MIFITPSEFRKKPTKEGIAATDKVVSTLAKQGVKVLGFYWTLGRYDSVFIIEGPDKDAVQNYMQSLFPLSDNIATETLVGLRREDAVKLLS